MQQRSDEWFAARLGKVTASRIPDVMARTKSGYGAGRKNYMAELLVERLTGQREESYINAAMQHGIDTEDEARMAYEFSRELVEEVGFVEHPTIAMSGASPDGLVGEDGEVEIKCPNTATHLETLLSKAVDRRYVLQMQWQMACTGRQWCDFVSYDPRLPERQAIVVIRVARDESLIAEITREVVLFLEELDALEAQVRAA